MRIVSAVILMLLLGAAVILPGISPTPAAGQDVATPTATVAGAPTATVAGTPIPTVTPPGATATATLLPTVTGTTTPGGVATVASVSPASVQPDLSTWITVNGSGFMPSAVITLDGRPIVTQVLSATQLQGTVPVGLPAGPYAISVVNPGVPPAPPLVGQFQVGAGGVTLFVPVAVKRGPDDSTAMFIQNIAPAGVTNVSVQFYDLSGFSNPGWTTPPVPVGPGENVVMDLAQIPNLPTPFSGSAVVRSPQPITAVVNRVIYSGSVELAEDGDVWAAQAPPASAGAFPVAAGPGAPQQTVPVAFGGYHGYSTTISVQNTTNAPATYAVTLFPTGFASPVQTINRVVPPQASARVKLGPENGVPPDFVGTAVVNGNGATMVVASETIHVQTHVLLSYSGFQSGANVMNAPLLFKNYNDWVSGAQVVNVSSGPVTVQAQIFQRDVPGSINLPPRPLGPNESYTYYLPAEARLPDDFVGSAVFTATGPIAVVVQQINDPRGTGMAYSGFAGGTPNISVPVIFKGQQGWDTGIQVQNLAPTDATVNVDYHLPDHTVVPDVARIPAGGSTTFYQPDVPGIPPGTTGASIVHALGGEPIVAIVNEVNYTRPGDASMAYEGINF